MKKINYLNLYLKQYKNIPNIVFWGTFIVLALSSIVIGIGFIGDLEGVIFLGAGVVFAIIDAYLNRFLTAIAISQKIVVADTLLSMKDCSSAPALNMEDELPEL